MIFCIYNIKGGVGKSTTTINLAYEVSKDKKVLILDLDSQGASTFFLQKEVKSKYSFSKLQKRGLLKFIKSTKFENIDVLPADFNFKNNLDFKKRDTLKKYLADIKSNYDYIFIDSPPTNSLIADNILIASDVVIIPTIPTILSIRTYNQMIDLYKNILKKKKVFLFLSMFDKRKNMHLELAKKLYNLPKKNVLKTAIDNSAIIEKMGYYMLPVQVFAKRSIITRQYENLWNEIKDKL